MSGIKKDLYIFHYHLLPGGVTDVIRHALSAFSESSELNSITVVCGREENTGKMISHMESLRDKGMDFTLTVIPELDYLSNQDKPLSIEDMKALLMKRFASPEALWLIHNYHLGKNWVLTAALNAIADEGRQKMIYQIHDYPECARYANLKLLKDNIDETLYPSSPSLRYCVINTRDYKIMKKAGMGPGEIHLLENPVPVSSNPAENEVDKKALREKLFKNKPAGGRFDPDAPIWLYPVRSIRRKNVLEGGFLNALREEQANLVLTLPGISSQEKAYSDLCEKAWAQGLITGFWGTGTLPDEAGISYAEMISGSDLIFSSSVQEGFGYMYLNALLWKKPLLCRYLDIMEGFLPLLRKSPSHLYNEVLVPAEASLKKSLTEAYGNRFGELGALIKPALREKLENELHTTLSGEALDFSYLAPEDQYALLEKLKDPSYRAECKELNAPLLQSVAQLSYEYKGNRKDDLVRSYGEESYRKAFSEIIESFEKGKDVCRSEGGEEGKTEIGNALQEEFSRLDFLRLLYR